MASFNPSLDISPNGRTLYYLVPTQGGRFQPYIRMLNELEARTRSSITGGVPVFFAGQHPHAVIGTGGRHHHRHDQSERIDQEVACAL